MSVMLIPDCSPPELGGNEVCVVLRHKVEQGVITVVTGN